MLKISNLGFAAFLMLKDKKLLSSPTKEATGKFEFYFELSQDDHDLLLHEYVTGEFSKFDTYLINLKKMLSGRK